MTQPDRLHDGPEQPGAALLEAVAVMDRLRSPGGCPWDAEQTHRSLAPYAIEEAYEVAEAAEAGDRDALAEELGDLLLQVLFHARVASEPDGGFDVDDVARGLVAKLVRRHPHVFAPADQPDGSGAIGAPGPSADDVVAGWDAIKATEKGRGHVLDGIPVALPALQRAQKVVRRLERASGDGAIAADARKGVAPEAAVPAAETSAADEPADEPAADEPAAVTPAARLGDALLALVREAEAAGVDAEAALRERVRVLEQHARAGTPGTT